MNTSHFFSSEPSLLIGREREQHALRDHLAAACAGRGSLVLIGGEAGIGKTALATSLCHEADQRSALILTGRCYDLTDTPPYGPWLELFVRYQPSADSPPVPAAFAERGTVGTVASQGELFNQVADFLTTLAARQPTVLLLDDLHWADPASLDLLRFLTRTLDSTALLIVVTYRTEEVSRHHLLYQFLPIFVREAQAHRLDLRRIEETDIRTLVTTRYPVAEADMTRFVSYLDSRSEGNPFFISELLHTLEEERVLGKAVDGWRLGNLTQIRVPMLLQQVIDRRLARLTDEAQRLLAIAAIIGQEVPLAIWATVANTEEERLFDVVEQMVGASILVATPDGTQVHFAHALIREAIYEGVLPARRRGVHRRVGEELIASPYLDPDAVAYHFQRAGDDRAVEWLTKAGERAQRAFAWFTARERYEAALARMGENETDERGWLLYRLIDVGRFNDPQAGDYCKEAIQIASSIDDQVLLALSLFWQGYHRHDVRKGLAEMEASIAVFTALSPADHARLAVQSRIDAFDEEYARGRFFARLFGSGRYAEALDWARRLPPDLLSDRAAGSLHASFGFGYRGLGYLYAALGQPEGARRAFTLAREAMEARGNYPEAGLTGVFELDQVMLPYQTDDLVGRQRTAEIAEALWERVVDYHTDLPAKQAQLSLMMIDGRWSEVRSVAQSVFAVGGFVIMTNRLFRFQIATVARGQGDLALAKTLIAEVLPEGLATDHGNAWGFRDSMACQRLAAALAMDEGDFPTARTWLEMHDRWLEWSGSIFGQADGALGWANYHRAAGNSDLAYDYATQALTHANDPRQPLALLAAHRLLGELDTDAGRFADAAIHLDAALTLADACAAPYERALTLLALAELRAATHERAQAHLMLDDARAICILLDAKPALARIDRLLARLNAVKDAAPTYPAGLSAREVEVLRLIVTGQTNREIATALFLAEKTIERHITHILTKTGAANRVAAVAFASQHGLI